MFEEFKKHMNVKAEIYKPRKIILGKDFCIFEFLLKHDAQNSFKLSKESAEYNESQEKNYKYFANFENNRFVIIINKKEDK